MKKILLLMAVCGLFTAAKAQNFNTFFNDSTLRIDYIFAGDGKKASIFVDELNQLPAWAGRRTHLAELPLEGNGQLTMSDEQTGAVIYRTSFSSLFQEWQCTEEASHAQKSFEHCLLVPQPKRPATVLLTLTDTHGRVVASLTHRIDPKDVLIRHIGQKSITPYQYVWKGGDPTTCIDVAIVAEGYTADEMSLFRRDAEATCQSLFQHEPFKRYRNRFNLVAVCSPSADTGVSLPRAADWRNTAVGSHFDTFYSDRYLTTLHLKQLHNLLAGIPYEHIIILANTAEYGGGGIYNSYTLTTAHHSDFRPVVVHEFGHSFGGLADEYFYDDQYQDLYPADREPWEQNITTLVNFEKKWKDMLPKGTKIPTPISKRKRNIFTRVGVFEGAGYKSKGAYRGCQECRMKINEAPAFCPVCQRALSRLIEFYTE